MFSVRRRSFFKSAADLGKNVISKDEIVKNDAVDIQKLLDPPPIIGELKRKKTEWFEKIQKLETVEEKLFGINMPHYYGWKSLKLNESYIRFNSLSLAQYITRSSIIMSDKLVSLYDELPMNNELDGIIQTIKPKVEDLILTENCHKLRNLEFMEQDDAENSFVNSIAYGMNRLILHTLCPRLPHLLDTEVDVEPRIEAFWFAGGIGGQPVKESEDAKPKQIDIPVQYLGTPILQLRHRFPLKELMPFVMSTASTLHVPEFKFDPRVLGYTFSNRHATSIPGFWPGDPFEFGLLSYHNTRPKNWRPITPDSESEEICVQAIFASYSWLLSQACYQGFVPGSEITYPLLTQTVLTNGQSWSFCAYQLNTIFTHSVYADKNNKRNVCFLTRPAKLYDAVDNKKVHGLNEDVLKSLLQFYINVPKERAGLNMKPYLGKNVKHVADIEDDERRVWLENGFKHLMSNRPRHRLPIEVHQWQKIYLIDNDTMPQVSNRLYAFQRTCSNSKRRLNDHHPKYVPKCLRKYPKLKKVGRWAKTYYPDV